MQYITTNQNRTIVNHTSPKWMTYTRLGRESYPKTPTTVSPFANANGEI